MERVGRGAAKLLLFGEHSAVYGHPTMGIGLPDFTELRILAKPGKGWRFPELSGEDAARLGQLLASLASFLPGAAGEGGEIRISSTIPRGLGFGSSAALCVALAKCFAGDGASERDIWSIAHRAEGFFHGRPSGVDTGLSLLGGLRSFHTSSGGLPESTRLQPFPMHLVVGALPRRKSTADLVGELHARIDAGDSKALGLIEELGVIARQAIDLVERAGPSGELGLLLGAAHRALGRLGLGDPGIDRLIDAGMESGAIGGKQSGAGSGGAFFLLYHSEDSGRASAVAIEESARRAAIGLAAPLRVVDSA